jgi:hypothetical protein
LEWLKGKEQTSEAQKQFFLTLEVIKKLPFPRYCVPVKYTSFFSTTKKSLGGTKPSMVCHLCAIGPLIPLRTAAKHRGSFDPFCPAAKLRGSSDVPIVAIRDRARGAFHRLPPLSLPPLAAAVAPLSPRDSRRADQRAGALPLVVHGSRISLRSWPTTQRCRPANPKYRQPPAARIGGQPLTADLCAISAHGRQRSAPR